MANGQERQIREIRQMEQRLGLGLLTPEQSAAQNIARQREQQRAEQQAEFEAWVASGFKGPSPLQKRIALRRQQEQQEQSRSPERPNILQALLKVLIPRQASRRTAGR